MTPRTVWLFSNGNTHVQDENKNTIKNEFRPWLQVYVQYLEHLSVDFSQLVIYLPTGKSYKFKDGSWQEVTR